MKCAYAHTKCFFKQKTKTNYKAKSQRNIYIYLKNKNLIVRTSFALINWERKLYVLSISG